MNEKLIERKLTREIKKRGGLCIKLLPFLETGLPDREVILPKGIHCYVELKSTGAILSPKQLIWRNRLQKRGHIHWSILTEKDYLCFLEWLMLVT